MKLLFIYISIFWVLSANAESQQVDLELAATDLVKQKIEESLNGLQIPLIAPKGSIEIENDSWQGARALINRPSSRSVKAEYFEVGEDGYTAEYFSHSRAIKFSLYNDLYDCSFDYVIDDPGDHWLIVNSCTSSEESIPIPNNFEIHLKR